MIEVTQIMICGTTENVEIHHVRKVKAHKGRTPIEKAVKAAGSKVIPLCRMHHVEIHQR